MYSTPILLITFNRPTHTRKLLSAVLRFEPSELYVFRDGPRDGNATDCQKCEEVRQTINELTDGREIRLHTLFLEKNLGCGQGPVTAINWFFSNEEQGIILEDDCIPHQSFFDYCQILLDKYRENEKISFIGGCNMDDDKHQEQIQYSYGFCSGHHETWGWASWRRVWQMMDYSLSEMSMSDFRGYIKLYFSSYKQQEYWLGIFEMVKENQMKGTCWDYQFYFSCWKKGMLAVYPKFNLVTNVGYGEDATHTKNKDSFLLNVDTKSILPLFHPERIFLDKGYDYRMLRKEINYEYGLKGVLRIPYRINKRLKRLVGHKGSWI